MSRGKLGVPLLLYFLLVSCEPVPVQYPPGGGTQLPNYPAHPGTVTPPQPSGQPPPAPPSYPQASGSQRSQYVWEKTMAGVSMGGSIAGPYGAGVGLIFGGLYGLFTADSHYEQLNAQIQSEQAKDKELEALLEQEIERQRELEEQLSGTGVSPIPNQKKEPQPHKKAVNEVKKETKESRVAKNTELGQLASLDKKEVLIQPSRSPFKNVEIKDINQDGVPDLWIYYNPQKPGEIIRQEEDTRGDGRVDTWSTFYDGKLARREIDTKGNGVPDTTYYYKNNLITREERDEMGNGQPSYRAAYNNGQLAKVEKDINRDGKMDLWISYDANQSEEVIAKEERDLNGDGTVDLWSYYEAGRLVRRDVSAVGLEYLSSQEKHPQLTPSQDPSPELPKS